MITHLGNLETSLYIKWRDLVHIRSEFRRLSHGSRNGRNVTFARKIPARIPIPRVAEGNGGEGCKGTEDYTFPLATHRDGRGKL